MNGKGAPTTGKKPITIPTLTITYRNNVRLRVPDRILPKLSVAFTEIVKPRNAINKYKDSRSKTPRNPNSSPKAEKIKSVECSGTKPSFDCVPLNKPFPKNPPDPRAILDCKRW